MGSQEFRIRVTAAARCAAGAAFSAVPRQRVPVLADAPDEASPACPKPVRYPPFRSKACPGNQSKAATGKRISSARSSHRNSSRERRPLGAAAGVHQRLFRRPAPRPCQPPRRSAFARRGADRRAQLRCVGQTTRQGRRATGQPLRDRLAIIAALKAVTLVTWFDEDTPLQRILDCRPDILVKGGDWPVERIVGNREVTGWGGRVLSLPFIHQTSTTGCSRRSGACSSQRCAESRYPPSRA
jgi:hypothetical protein